MYSQFFIYTPLILHIFSYNHDQLCHFVSKSLSKYGAAGQEPTCKQLPISLIISVLFVYMLNVVKLLILNLVEWFILSLVKECDGIICLIFFQWRWGTMMKQEYIYLMLTLHWRCIWLKFVFITFIQHKMSIPKGCSYITYISAKVKRKKDNYCRKKHILN
jgi:hypothetical protein